MSSPLDRRSFLRAVAAVPLALTFVAQATARHDTAGAIRQLTQIEQALGGRIGVFALDTAGHSALRYHSDQRFPLCSTFKLLLTGGILQRSARANELMQRRILYTKSDLASYSPITEKHVGEGMTIAALCAAAIQYSDNTAANLLMKLLGGPASVTAFAHSLGDRQFRLDR